MHNPVLLNLSIKSLNIKPDGIYVDGTFGRGGHAKLILEKLTTGKLIAFDRDLDAINHANIHFENYIKNGKMIVIHAAFSTIAQEISKLNLTEKIDSVLFDLGVSSPQLDIAERGFSFMHDGPLDMRMDQSKGKAAYDIIKYNSINSLAHIFSNYGEEKYAWKIAKNIKKYIQQGKLLNRTLSLAKLIEKTIGRKERKHPATRCFQALRIYVNDELNEVSKGINNSFSILKNSGRLATISFHSLEDRIVKNFMKNLIRDNSVNIPRGMPIISNFSPKAKWIIKQGKALDEEIYKNVRSRSAILRVIEKV